MSKQRSRGWCLTLNNYLEEEYNNLKSDDTLNTVEKWIIGKEVGKNGTPHLQGYIYFKNARTLEQVRGISSRAHWEIAKGNPKQNFKYCSKEGDFECKGFKVFKPMYMVSPTLLLCELDLWYHYPWKAEDDIYGPEDDLSWVRDD